jgi:uncharacterized protein YhaN
MRINRFDLKAFGPFTNRSFAFDSEPPGLHILFGPNEAGKSSSLRALKALLFGFPGQTPDNFIHNYDQLRVDGCLENQAGEQLCFQRRKKRVGDVMDEEGNPLEPTVLAPFLSGLETEIFENLYGIDHETLVKGGEEILAQKGEVGKALFAAGAGISSLRELITQLDNEGTDLFKPRGKKPEINMAVKRYRDLTKAAKDAALSSNVWKDHQKALKAAETERSRLEKERRQKDREQLHLKRLAQAIPELATLKKRKDQLYALGEIISLPCGFARRYEQIRRDIRETRQQLERDTERKTRLVEKQRTISFNRAILDQAERIDDFHQRLGEYRKGQQDRPLREGMRMSLRRDAGTLLERIRPDLTLNEVETLRPVLIAKRTIHTLSTRYEAIIQQLNQTEKQHRTAEQELASAEKTLSATPEISEPRELQQAVKRARKAGNLDAVLEKGRTEIEQHHDACTAELKRLGRWSGDLKTLMELALPLLETVQRFENRFSRIAEEQRELAKQRKKDENDRRQALAEIRKLTFTGEVPSEEDLFCSRAGRDERWHLIRRRWLDGEDMTESGRSYVSDLSLAEAYEKDVEWADGIADRLRREADRVATAAAAHARAETLEKKLAEHEKETIVLNRQYKSLEEKWQQVWQPLGITPLSPKEMNGWLAGMDKLRFRVSDMFQKRQDMERSLKQRKALTKMLQDALTNIGETDIPAGETLEPVLVLAETVLERMAGQKNMLEQLKTRKENAGKVFQQAMKDHKNAQEALAEWQNRWRKALTGLGRKEDLFPDEASDLLDTLQSCFDKFKEADDLKKRIKGIDRDADTLEADLKTLLDKIAPELLTLPLDQAILQLRTRLTQARENAALFQKHSEELDALQEDIAAAEKLLQGAEKQMAELLQTARCNHPADVPAVIERHAEYQKLMEKISDSETSLARIAAGMTIEALSEQTAGLDPDELPGRIRALQSDIEDRINPEINRISQLIGEEHKVLADMDGNADAAEIAEKMQQELAGIRRMTEHYIQVKLAAKILQQEIERYREAHQDPVLKRASACFSTLTLNSFADLRTDVDDRGEPVLVGIRPDEQRLTVDKMSSGTRDQLYLALRIATLEWRLETSEPMPFIIDDILINFDDERSAATLKVLADLSKKNQVILFTHHRRIVEQAKAVESTGTIQIHEL